jgi:hypothetical protein
MCYDGSNYYFVSADGMVVKRKMQSFTEKISKVKLPEFEFDVLAYYPMRYLDGRIWLFPYRKNTAFKIDVATGDVTEAEDFNDEHCNSGINQSYLAAIISNERIYAVTGNSHMFIEYDPKTNIKREAQIRVSVSDYAGLHDFLEASQTCDQYINESEVLDIRWLTSALSKFTVPDFDSAVDGCSAHGKAILDLIKKEVMPE